MKTRLLTTLILITQLITFTLAQDCEVIELNISNVQCNGNNDGEIVIGTTTSCAQPVSYSWAHGASGPQIGNLSPGLYEVTITTSDGFTIEKNWLITEPDDITLVADVYDPTCAGTEDGSIYMNPNGGTPSYEYQWSNGETFNFIQGLSPGTYNVTVTDDNFCTKTGSYEIVDLEIVAYTLDDFQDISCDGANNGSITVSGTGGIGSYYYDWSNGSQSNSISNLSPGTYTVTVADFFLCDTVVEFYITNPSSIFVTFPQVTDLTCYDNNSGSIEINAAGGTGNLSYNWSNGDSGNIIENLQSGNYTLTITDDNNCAFTDTYTVAQPSAIIVTNAIIEDLSCFDDASGSLEIDPAGGTGSFSFSWS
ncbi:MAG: hypothetical protein ACJATI_004777, partial [Halioglobus sp.]